MATKKPDLGAMTITKAAAAGTLPFAENPAPADAAHPAKSLTIKLDGSLYAALREYCHRTERERGRRITHQEVLVAALKPYIGFGS
jgi:hypothetical protein